MPAAASQSAVSGGTETDRLVREETGAKGNWATLGPLEGRLLLILELFLEAAGEWSPPC